MEDLMGQINNMIKDREIGNKQIANVGRDLEEKNKDRKEIEEKN